MSSLISRDCFVSPAEIESKLPAIVEDASCVFYDGILNFIRKFSFAKQVDTFSVSDITLLNLHTDVSRCARYIIDARLHASLYTRRGIFSEHIAQAVMKICRKGYQRGTSSKKDKVDFFIFDDVEMIAIVGDFKAGDGNTNNSNAIESIKRTFREWRKTYEERGYTVRTVLLNLNGKNVNKKTQGEPDYDLYGEESWQVVCNGMSSTFFTDYVQPNMERLCSNKWDRIVEKEVIRSRLHERVKDYLLFKYGVPGTNRLDTVKLARVQCQNTGRHAHSHVEDLLSLNAKVGGDVVAPSDYSPAPDVITMFGGT